MCVICPAEKGEEMTARKAANSVLWGVQFYSRPAILAELILIQLLGMDTKGWHGHFHVQ